MKKLLIALVVLVVVIGAVFAWAAMNANALIESYKPDLERMASDAVGSSVTLGAIDVSIFPRAKLIVDEVKVVNLDDPTEALALQNLTLKIKLLPLLSKNLTITRLSLSDPSVTAIMDEDGIYIAGLPKPVAAAADSEENAGAETESAAPADVPIDVTLQAFSIQNATLTFRDKLADVDYVVSGLDVDASIQLENGIATLNDLSGGGTAIENVAFTFSGNGVAYALKTGEIVIAKLDMESLGNRFSLAGTLNPNDPAKTVKLTSTDIALASLTPLYDFFAPGLNDMGLQGSVQPALALALAPEGGYTAVGSVGLAGVGADLDGLAVTGLTGQISLDADQDNQRVHGENIAGQFNSAPMEMNIELSIEGAETARESLHVGIFSGTADLKSVVRLAEEGSTFTLDLAAADVQMGEALKALVPDVDVELTGIAEANANLAGNLDDTLTSSTTGDLKFGLHDGLLKQINLGSDILAAVTNLQFLTGNLLGSVPQTMQKFVQEEHTVLKTLSGSFAVAEETLTTDDLRLESTYFSLDAKGTINFDTAVDLESTIYFSPEFSAEMVAKTKEIGVLLDDQGRLAFPVKIDGTPPGLIVVPDVSKILKTTVKETVKEKGRKLLRGILNEND